MPLPPPAIGRILAQIRNASDLPRPAPCNHTVPINEQPWRQHADALAQAIISLKDSLTPPRDDFNELRGWVDQIMKERELIFGLLFALKPFEPFDPGQADELLELLDALPGHMHTSIESGDSVNSGYKDALSAAAEWWLSCKSPHPRHCLQQAFGMDVAPVGAKGQFQAELVLQHYAYRNSDLLQLLIPHLISLDIPHLTDVLAGVYAVGRIVECDDPIVAYIAAKTLTIRYFAADPTIANQFRRHMKSVEPAMQRARLATARAYEIMHTQTNEPEARALALADRYKRTIEGPFRQYSWASYCLSTGQWSRPPMLQNLKERLASEDGLLGALVTTVVLTNMRNSETHETLAWDGFTDQFVTETGRVDETQVAEALRLATSFVHGSEAGFTAIRALDIKSNTVTLPSDEDDGRMPAQDRVRAFFGTNKIALLDAQLNTPNAYFYVRRLANYDINPCFQALVLARRLLPRTEKFEVSTSKGRDPFISVEASALDATMLSWSFAVSHLDKMPLSTFLTANLDARRKVEPKSTALRSAAWIAVDDAVDTIDGSPEVWSEEMRHLINTRLQVVEIAIAATTQWLVEPNSRLESVQTSVAELRNWVANDAPSRALLAEEQLPMRRLRTQWNQWGPVPRHPLVKEDFPPSNTELPPALRPIPSSMHYRTL